MNVNTIIGSTVAFTSLPTTNTAFAEPASAKTTSSPVESSSNQIENLRTVGANTNSKASLVSKKLSAVEIEGAKKLVRTMSHVVETYNLHGKPRIKFMDSNNNVIYQIPSELVAKTEDMMKNPVIPSNTKA